MKNMKIVTKMFNSKTIYIVLVIVSTIGAIISGFNWIMDIPVTKTSLSIFLDDVTILCLWVILLINQEE